MDVGLRRDDVREKSPRVARVVRLLDNGGGRFVAGRLDA